MKAAVRSSLGLVVLLMSAARLRAQCPDGTPPPCRAPVAARVAVDPNAVAIFPFRLTGSSATDAAWLREGAVDLLNLALDDAGGWRVINPRTLLARTRGFTDATTEAEAARVARSVGAGQMILGSAVVIGPTVRAQATLYDIGGTRQLASVEARGALADPTPVIDSLAAGLARARLVATGGSPRRIQEFATTSPRALRAYLAAERAGRQGQWQEAADSLQGAIAADSSFGVAYYRLRVAGTYGANTSLSQDAAIVVAARFRDRLPCVGLAALNRGDSVTARQALAAARGILPYGASTRSRFLDIQQWASLALARLGLASGDLVSAERCLDYGTFATGAVPLRGDMEELRAVIAERRGDIPAARAAYGRVVAIWRQADPQLQPRVAAAQAALARLGTH